MMRRLWFLLGIVVLLGIPLVLLGSNVMANPYVQDCEHAPFSDSSGLISSWPNTNFCEFIYPASNGFRSGGVVRDGITPFYPVDYVYPEDIPRLGGRRATFEVIYDRIDEANEWLFDDHPVLTVEINGDARAYPLGILTRHEIANTTIGDIPVAVTFCPLCNTGVVFDRRLNGMELHLGVSGLLRFSDMIMWDHETESWWQQSTGEGLVGELAGEQLIFIPSSMTSYAQFKEQYPDGMVLSNQDNAYDRNPYTGYDSNPDPFLFGGYIDERLPATARVLGYRHQKPDGTEIFTAYPFELLSEIIVANDMVGGEPRAIFWQPGARSALDRSSINDSKEVGAATLFDPSLGDGTVLTFEAEGTTIKDTLTGSTWNIFGQAVEGELTGIQLDPVLSVTHFWFAWQAFHSSTIIYEDGATTDSLIGE